MASIQQSINNLISAGLAGTLGAAYMYKDTPQYEAKELEKEIDKYYKVMETQETDEQLGDYYEKIRQKEERVAEIDPTKERLARVEEIAGERAEEEVAEAKKTATPKETAEANSYTRLLERMLTQQSMEQGLATFKEQLSAKDRNRLDHMQYKVQKKEMKQNNGK